MRDAPTPVPALSPADADWLREHGAADVRLGVDGVIEFSARPLALALADAARDLLPRRMGAGRAIAVGVLTLK